MPSQQTKHKTLTSINTRDNMEQQEIAELRRKLAESEARATDERQRREEAQRRREEAQRRREEAERGREAAEGQLRSKNLIEYLEACHSFSLSLEVVTDAELTTQGDTTKPTGRVYPQRIVPWDDFERQQEKIWEKLSISPSFASRRVYPNAAQLDYVRKHVKPLSSELDLRNFAQQTVEDPVLAMIIEVYGDEQLRERLQLQGTMKFESHTNLSQSSEAEPTGASRKRAGTADRFCIYQKSSGQSLPVMLIEYKLPHKLSLAHLTAGLKGEIRPAEEVINNQGDDFEFLSKSLVTAVITQLFSYMVRKVVLWGYIFVGEAIIFLNIADDPTTVSYYLSIPCLDFQVNPETRLHRTSVAQIFAFSLNSLSTKALSQEWHDIGTSLDTWNIEYIDILKKIPETERKEPREMSYKAVNWKR